MERFVVSWPEVIIERGTTIQGNRYPTATSFLKHYAPKSLYQMAQDRTLKSFNVGSQQVIIHTTASNTNGVCAVLEMLHPVDNGPPLHMHTR